MSGTDNETNDRAPAVDADPAAQNASNTMSIWVYSRRRQGFHPSSDDIRQEISKRWVDFSPEKVQAIEKAVGRMPFTQQ